MPRPVTISQAKSASGKVVYFTQGDPAYRKPVEKALQASRVCSFHVTPFVHKGLFAKTLREAGVPEKKVQEYVDNIHFDEDLKLE